MNTFRTSLILLILLIASPALAQDASITSADEPESLSGRVEGDVRVGSVDGDFVMGMHFTALLVYDALLVDLTLPVRVVIQDTGAPNDGILRDEDWDDVEDFVRLLRFVRWSQPGDTFYAQLGELNGLRFGHGTVVDRYLNTTSVDRYQPGLHAVVNTEVAGGEVMLDNVIRPELMGARAFIRPLALTESPSAPLDSWTVGLSWAGDIHAPRLALTDAATGAPRIDGDERVFSYGSVHVLTLDSDIEVFRNDWLSLTPYADGALMISNELGGAFHLGLLSRFGLGEHSALNLKTEFQHLGAHAMGQYFDTAYELQRGSYPGTGQTPRGKLDVLESLDTARTGGLAQLGLDIEGLVQLGVTYRDYTGPSNSHLTLQATVPTLERIQLGAFFTSNGVDAERLFDPESLILQGMLRLQIIDELDVTATYHRNWRLDTDAESPGFGQYQARDEWSVGAGASFEF